MRHAFKQWLKITASEKRAVGGVGTETSVYVPYPPFDDLGAVDTMYLSRLIDTQMRLFPKVEDTSDGWFPCSIPDLKKWTGLNPAPQSRLMNVLENNGYIERSVKGYPVKRLIRINYDRWLEKINSR